MQRRKNPRPHRRSQNSMDYAVKGMVDMERVAVTGIVASGVIGTVGGLLHV